MMPQDIVELHNFFTEIESLTSSPVVLAKCQEAKAYIRLLGGAVTGATELLDRLREVNSQIREA